MTLTPPPAPDEERRPADTLGAAIGDATRARLGISGDENDTTGAVIWKAMGGVRGIIEAVVPSLAFLVLFSIWPEELWISLGVSVGLAMVLTLVRLVQKGPAGAAFGGLIATAFSAALALWTGSGTNNFLPGLVTNAVYGTAMLLSALIGWGLIGVGVGFVMNEGTAWRADARKRRVFFWLTIAWAALFFARLAVQLPLFLTDQTVLLGTLKLIMGIPLFAPLLALTWLVVRGLYPKGRA